MDAAGQGAVEGIRDLPADAHLIEGVADDGQQGVLFPGRFRKQKDLGPRGLFRRCGSFGGCCLRRSDGDGRQGGQAGGAGIHGHPAVGNGQQKTEQEAQHRCRDKEKQVVLPLHVDPFRKYSIFSRPA